MKTEKNYKIAIKNKSKKLPIYPYKKGDIIGNFIVNCDDYIYHHKRYQVEMTCQCGIVVYRRLSNILKLKNIWCAKCRGYNNYPIRKTQLRKYPNDIHISWLTDINTNSNLKRGSKILESTITSNDLRNQYDIQNGCCIYTGIKLNVLTFNKAHSNASIDRKNSSIGYIKENIQWVYKPINRMKNDFTENEFIFLCKKVSNFKDNFEPS